MEVDGSFFRGFVWLVCFCPSTEFIFTAIARLFLFPAFVYVGPEGTTKPLPPWAASSGMHISGLHQSCDCAQPCSGHSGVLNGLGGWVPLLTHYLACLGLWYTHPGQRERGIGLGCLSLGCTGGSRLAPGLCFLVEQPHSSICLILI